MEKETSYIVNSQVTVYIKNLDFDVYFNLLRYLNRLGASTNFTSVKYLTSNLEINELNSDEGGMENNR